MRVLEGKLVDSGIKVGIVAARFNEFIVSKLVAGAKDGLVRHDVSEENIDLAWVPGAFEIPLIASKMAKSGKYDAVILKESNALHDKLVENVNYFRDKMTAAGFDIKPTQSAICAVMLYDAKLSQIYAARMQEEGIYVTGFYYPVVPKDQARIRVQISAGHEKEHLDKCIAAFIKVGKELGVLK